MVRIRENTNFTKEAKKANTLASIADKLIAAFLL